MRKIEIDETREILLSLMDNIHAFCEKYGIKYYLAFGTLLGAVRHNGFIPWDDDIDIVMPRPDYDKFIELYSKEGDERLLASNVDERYKYPFAKLCKKNTLLIEKGGNAGVEIGVYLDVFPLDALGNSEKDAKKIMRELLPFVNLNLSLLVKQWRKEVSFVKNFAIWNLHNIALIMGGHRKLLKKIDKIIRTYDYNESAYVGEVIDEIQYKRITDKRLYENRELHVFEGRQFYIPSGYDKILKNFYGDYMTPPPVDKRVLTHDFEAFSLEE